MIFPIALRGATHTLRVGNRAEASALLAEGGRLIADYGDFEVIEAEASSRTNTVEFRDDFNVVELNARPLDTRSAEVRALRGVPGPFSGQRLHLVQFAGPVKPAWVDELKLRGAQIVSYIPQNTYLIYGDARMLGRVQSWAGTNVLVQWDGDYADEYKIHPTANPANGTNPARTDWFAIQLLDDPSANRATLALVDRLKLEPIRQQYHALAYVNLIVRMPPAAVSQIAAQPEVISIQPYFEPRMQDERQDQIIAGNILNNAPGGPGYRAWLAGKGFTPAQFAASGFIVDVSDSGIDNGTTAPGHFDLYQLGDPTQTSRVIYNRLEGSPNPDSTLAGCDGHGNLNAHIIAGYGGPANIFPHADSAGYFYDLGVCPFVKVGSSVVFDPELWTAPNFANLQSQAYNSGARISANSWGGAASGAYTADAQTYDALVRDAQPGGSTYAAAGNQEMVLVFAAGNFGASARTIMSPGSAKNVITVGAAENVRSLSYANGGTSVSGNDGCNKPDSVADSTEDIAGFSSRGPCGDGRMKPDLVAPGTHITGGAPQSSTNYAGTGSAISCFTADGICALPGSGTVGSANNFFPAGQQFYTVSSGTSHSTPAVAGGCALVRQYFINHGLAAPSPAMTKAFLMNSARYLTGAYANDSLWSPSQGMGELNLGMAFDGGGRILRDQVAADIFTSSGQTRTFTGGVADTNQPFRVTIVWTDAPGSTTAASALNNDLDLTVTIDGNTYYGNAFSGAYTVPGGSPDHKNNVESVFLPPGTAGGFTVTITAASINSDGVPNQPPGLDQDFALVVYNATQPANLGIGQIFSANTFVIGTTQTVTLNVTNFGPATADGVFVTDALPSGVNFAGADPGTGIVTNNAGLLTWSIGTLAGDAVASMSLQLVASSSGWYTNVAEVFSGSPSGSAVAVGSFWVGAPPTISAIAISNDSFVIRWNSVPGRSYRLQSENNLAGTNWIDASPDILATDVTVSVTNSLGLAGQRFFRVVLLP